MGREGGERNAMEGSTVLILGAGGTPEGAHCVAPFSLSALFSCPGDVISYNATEVFEEIHAALPDDINPARTIAAVLFANLKVRLKLQFRVLRRAAALPPQLT